MVQIREFNTVSPSYGMALTRQQYYLQRNPFGRGPSCLTGGYFARCLHFRRKILAISTWCWFALA